jgi:hypothetical protein
MQWQKACGPIAAIGTIMAATLDPLASARADEPCAQVRVPTGLSPEWTGAVDNLRGQIAQLSPADCQPMTISIEPQEEGMRIIAITSDGRRTYRTVRSADNLAAVAMGLLITIPGEPLAPPAAPSTPPAPPVPRPPDVQATVRVAPEANEARAKAIALWTGIAGGIRLTSPTALAVLDIEARADILIDPWLMLITLRSAVVSCLGQQGIDCDVYNDVSIGAGVGRRFHVGAPDIDLAFEPSLVVMHMEYDAASGSSGTEGPTVVDTDVALRLDVSARLSVPVDPRWALTITLDGGLAPAMLTRPAALELPVGGAAGTEKIPPFPAWSGGVRLGVSGALL